MSGEKKRRPVYIIVGDDVISNVMLMLSSLSGTFLICLDEGRAFCRIGFLGSSLQANY